ncbi:MAG: 30S ribosomal protein S4 [Planctomycetia bacterium]|nr:30S ribosomal protein S4 [Planctomycetia bacterium]
MAHYVGPKARINRRFVVKTHDGEARMDIFESAGAIRATTKRPFAPGMARPRGRKSVYGQSLAAKQAIKYAYGISERQLRKLYAISKRQQGNTGENLKVLCERRLDNVIRRAGLAKTRPQARQGVAHRHFLVNGVPTTSASFSVRPGDVISVKKSEKLQEMYKGIFEEMKASCANAWLVVDEEKLAITVTSMPMAADFTLPVEIDLVIEFLAR